MRTGIARSPASGHGSALATTGTAAQLAVASIAANTRRAYDGAMRCLAEHLGGAPLDDKTLVGYLAVLFESGRSPRWWWQPCAARLESPARSRPWVPLPIACWPASVAKLGIVGAAKSPAYGGYRPTPTWQPTTPARRCSSASTAAPHHAGRWQSPAMPARYAAGQLAARGAVATLRYGAE